MSVPLSTFVSSRGIRWTAGITAIACASLVGLTGPLAQAAEPPHDRIVSANPENFTPNVEDGRVNAMVQIGNRIIAVGKFTKVTQAGTTQQVTRNSIFAFNATTGVLDTTFVPNVGTKEVMEVVDGGLDAQGNPTVYIGGAFTTVNGTATAGKVARINATTGALVSTFKAPKSNGIVSDMQLSNGKLYIGGAFTTLGTASRTLLAALNPSSGADTGSVNLTFSDTFNGGAINIKHFDISDDGNTLVAVGNWRNVNGQSRVQIAMIDTSGATATLSPWATSRYAFEGCASVFDTYMRDVDIAPSGDYFVSVATGAQAGGSGSGTLCDAAARWELGPQSSGQNPSWVDYSGGDTFTQVKITAPAVYVGGHFRWLNNPFAADSAGQGAVSRTGLAALDPRNGVPFTWDPTRARGVGVWEFLPTTAGLWVGHDTNQTGKETRKRIALFPLAGGTVVPAENTGSLPGDVYSLGRKATATSGHWVARVNAGGPTLLANDSGPDWAGDTGATSPYRTGGNTADSGSLPITRDASVPASTPAVFPTERWGASEWNFTAPVGDELEVRLYFANACSCTENVGQRVFDVAIDGTTVLDDYDIVADVGDQSGTMKSYTITSDGNVDIDFSNVVENPLINGIEIIDNDVAIPPAGANDTVVKRLVSEAGAASPAAVSSSVAWSSDRGAMMINDKLYTGWSDGTFKVRTFNGTTFGTATNVNLNGLTDFAADVANMTGMFYDKATGRLYYTLSGQPTLYYRYFTPQSQIVGAVRFAATGNDGGVDWSDTTGMFLSGGRLYLASGSDGNLRSIGWTSAAGTIAGTLSDPISGPATTDGNDYRARGTFLYAG